jgi:outer membrane protein OmpA-like peptidoglycan-associated protein
MKNVLVILSSILLGTSLFLPSLAQAQEFTLRLEPGVAIPVTSPQDHRFKIGGDLAVKPEIGLGSYIGIGPSVSLLALPSNVSGVDTGTAWMFGGFIRVKRPHDSKNTGSGFSAVSPWADADLGFVRTGPLDRLGWSVAAGASVPTSRLRDLWIGPFVRYQNIYQEHVTGFNSNSANIIIAGLSFEFGAKAAKKVEHVNDPIVPVVVVLEPEPVLEPAPPVVVYEDIQIEGQETIQFTFDSAELSDSSKKELDVVAEHLLSVKHINLIRVEGHASSEGPVKYNDALSERRAKAVLDELVANGIPQDIVS